MTCDVNQMFSVDKYKYLWMMPLWCVADEWWCQSPDKKREGVCVSVNLVGTDCCVCDEMVAMFVIIQGLIVITNLMPSF